MELSAEQRTDSTSMHTDCSDKDTCGNGENPENCGASGEIQCRRLRPVSVIGATDVFPADAEEKDDRLPSVSCFNTVPNENVT